MARDRARLRLVRRRRAGAPPLRGAPLRGPLPRRARRGVGVLRPGDRAAEHGRGSPPHAATRDRPIAHARAPARRAGTRLHLRDPRPVAGRPEAVHVARLPNGAAATRLLVLPSEPKLEPCRTGAYAGSMRKTGCCAASAAKASTGESGVASKKGRTARTWRRYVRSTGALCSGPTSRILTVSRCFRRLSVTSPAARAFRTQPTSP